MACVAKNGRKFLSIECKGYTGSWPFYTTNGCFTLALIIKVRPL